MRRELGDVLLMDRNCRIILRLVRARFSVAVSTCDVSSQFCYAESLDDHDSLIGDWTVFHRHVNILWASLWAFIVQTFNRKKTFHWRLLGFVCVRRHRQQVAASGRRSVTFVRLCWDAGGSQMTVICWFRLIANYAVRAVPRVSLRRGKHGERRGESEKRRKS